MLNESNVEQSTYQKLRSSDNIQKQITFTQSSTLDQLTIRNTCNVEINDEEVITIKKLYQKILEKK